MGCWVFTQGYKPPTHLSSFIFYLSSDDLNYFIVILFTKMIPHLTVSLLKINFIFNFKSNLETTHIILIKPGQLLDWDTYRWSPLAGSERRLLQLTQEKLPARVDGYEVLNSSWVKISQSDVVLEMSSDILSNGTTDNIDLLLGMQVGCLKYL